MDMKSGLGFALILFSALGSGLMAGLFFTFSTFVMRALARLPPAQGVAAMQSINAEIMTPLFGLVFFGTAVTCGVLAISSFWRLREPGAFYLLAGGVFYLLGVILITMVVNVPKNEALAALEANSAQAASLWARYVPEWTAWNHVRTVAGVGAAAAFTLALR